MARMMDEIAAQYRAVIDEAASARGQPEGVRRRTLKRLRRELRRIRQRDYFPPDVRQQAHDAVEELAALREPAR